MPCPRAGLAGRPPLCWWQELCVVDTWPSRTCGLFAVVRSVCWNRVESRCSFGLCVGTVLLIVVRSFRSGEGRCWRCGGYPRATPSRAPGLSKETLPQPHLDGGRTPNHSNAPSGPLSVHQNNNPHFFGRQEHVLIEFAIRKLRFGLGSFDFSATPRAKKAMIFP